MNASNDGTDTERIESRTKFVSASPQAIFDLLADPAAHARFDGSGTVQGSRDGQPERLELGSRFGMRMRFGLPYRITNQVVEFDEPNLIAWRHLGRHVWRYRLREADGGTEVTEEFDWGPSIAPWALELAGYPQRNGKAVEATLQRLADLFETGSGDGSENGSQDGSQEESEEGSEDPTQANG